MKKTLSHAITLITLFFSSSLLAGDFHYQIDVMSKILGDQQGKINAVQMSWLYDEKISSMLLQGEDLTPAKRQASLDAVGQQIMIDLQGLNYFTGLEINDKPAKTAAVKTYGVELLEEKYLRLLFTIPLEQAVTAHNTKLSISLADPNGAGMLYYDSPERIIIDPSSQAQCNIDLINFDEVEHGKAAQLADIVCQ